MRVIVRGQHEQFLFRHAECLSLSSQPLVWNRLSVYEFVHFTPPARRVPAPPCESCAVGGPGAPGTPVPPRGPSSRCRRRSVRPGRRSRPSRPPARPAPPEGGLLPCA